VASGCKNSAGTTIGHIYYLQNAGAAICHLTAGLSASTAIKLTSFYTPWYVLSTAERVVYSHVTLMDSHAELGRQTTKITYTDSFPLLANKEFADSVLMLTAINGHSIARQREDYKFTFRLSAADTGTDIQLVKMFAVNVPTTTPDFAVLGGECIEDEASEIELENCWIESGKIWARVVSKTTYRNNHFFRVRTLNLALRNPSTSTSTNVNTFSVTFYGWNGATPATPSNYPSLVISANIASQPLSYTQTATYEGTPVSASVPPFTFYQPVHESYFH
jgi:hypothetical protein